MKLNKKAIATSVMVDVWALIAYFLVFIIIYISIIAQGSVDYKLTVEELKESETMHLLNVLRTPIEINKKIITIAEYAALYDSDPQLSSDDASKNIKDKLSKINLYDKGCLIFNFHQKSPLKLGCESSAYKYSATNADVRFPSKNGNIINATFTQRTSP